MNRLRSLGTSLLVVALSVSPALADSGDIGKVQNFLTNVIQVLVTVAGALAAVFFVIGGIGYISSSGSPEKLDKAKRTIIYSAIGLAVAIGALVLTNVVSDIAKNAFS